MEEIERNEVEGEKQVDTFEEVINSDNPIGTYGNLSEEHYENEVIEENTGIEGEEFELVDPELRNETGNTKEDEMSEVGDQYELVTPTDLTEIVNNSSGTELEDPDDLAGIGQYQNTEDSADNFDAVPVLRVGEDYDENGVEEGESTADGDADEDEVEIGVVPEQKESPEPFEGGIQDLSPEEGPTPLEEKSDEFMEEAAQDIENDELDLKTLNGIEIEGEEEDRPLEEDLDNPDEAGEFYSNYAEECGEEGDCDSDDDEDDYEEEDDSEDESEDAEDDYEEEDDSEDEDDEEEDDYEEEDDSEDYSDDDDEEEEEDEE